MTRKVVFLGVLAAMLLGATRGYSQVTPGTLFYFPQVAVGSGGGLQYLTLYAFSNPGATPLQVRVDLFDSSGNALDVEVIDLDGRPVGIVASANVVVPPNGISGLVALSRGGLRTGWAKVTSSGVWAMSAFLSFALNGAPISAVGVAPMTAHQELITAVTRDDPDGVDVGIAVANPSDSALVVTATLSDADGVQVRQTTLSLAPRGQRAIFSHELFPNTAGTFDGRITLTAPAAFTAMSLLLDGPLMTSLPIFRR